MQIKNLYGHKQLIFSQNFGHNFLFIRNLNLKYSPFLLEFEILTVMQIRYYYYYYYYYLKISSP